MMQLTAPGPAPEPERARVVLEPEGADRRPPIVAQGNIWQRDPGLGAQEDGVGHQPLVNHVERVLDQLP